MATFDFVNLLGLTAAFCTTLSFLPQAIRVIRTKSTKDISLGMYVLFSSGIALWLVYGLLTNDLPIILANMITLVFSVTILVMKIRFK